jgi:predicted Rossmann-fold nucleotide-binding protein
VLYGKEFWDNVLNLEFMVDFGTVSAKDLKLFHKSDTVEDAFEYITKSLIELEEDGAVGSR